MIGKLKLSKTQKIGYALMVVGNGLMTIYWVLKISLLIFGLVM